MSDAEAIREVLVGRYGFAPHDVRLLIDQGATRAGILEAIDYHLIESAGPGDQLVFYYAGHGSQVANSGSGERDGMDESLVPADSRIGAPDIRDKELRHRFNRALDRGARLTVILDSCHSGSGVRGPWAERPSRGVAIDPRDVSDDTYPGPRLEDRDTVIISAAQDFQAAWEIWDPESELDRGAFTLALLRGIRMASVGESAETIFKRARAWLHGPAGVYQEPVLAGPPESLARPLFGEVGWSEAGRGSVAVERLEPEGTVRLQAGWIHGLSVGSELEPEAGADPQGARLEVVELLGLTRSRARVLAPSLVRTASDGPGDLPREPVVASPRPGSLFSVVGWSVPPGPPLLVWMAVADDEARAWASRVVRVATGAGLELVSDPTEGPAPTHVLAWRSGGWQLIGEDLAKPVSETEVDALVEDLLRFEAGARLLVSLPIPESLATAFESSLDSLKVERVEDPAKADYFLVGRESMGDLEVALVLQGATSRDWDLAPLPLRSRWHPVEIEESGTSRSPVPDLVQAAAGLARVRAWLELAGSSPPDQFPYDLALRSARTGLVVAGSEPVRDGEEFFLQLSAPVGALEKHVARRYVYVFVIDRSGKCTLLYPEPYLGSVENRFPLRALPPFPTVVTLGEKPALRVVAPFGIDNYYLLTTSTPIQNPLVLECPGVRGTKGERPSALEELLLETGSSVHRGVDRALTVPDDWDLKRIEILSVGGDETSGESDRRRPRGQ